MFVITSKMKSLVKLYPEQKVLAEKLGISESQLSLTYNEEREPSKDFIEAVCKFTGWTMDDVVEIK